MKKNAFEPLLNIYEREYVSNGILVNTVNKNMLLKQDLAPNQTQIWKLRSERSWSKLESETGNNKPESRLKPGNRTRAWPETGNRDASGAGPNRNLERET